MKYIELSKDKVTKVSDVDIEFATKYKWYYAGDYAKNNKLGFLHRNILEIMLGGKIPKHLEADHINRDKLDNRRENLRLATPAENRTNYAGNIGKSGFRGVKQGKGRSKWRADIQIKGKKVLIGGSYTSPIEAAKAYNERAKEVFGEFAYLNPVS